MADPTLTNSASGTSTSATTEASFGFTATAGRLLVVTVSADDYKTGTPSGYTQSTNNQYEGYHGHYLWWKIAAGSESSVSYTIGSAIGSAWTVCEYDSIEGTGSLDTSNGAGQNSSLSLDVPYSSPNVTPSTGRRFIVVSMGASQTVNFTGVGSWTNSFTEDKESFHNTGATHDLTSMASRSVDGNGSTTFSTAVNFATDGAVTTSQSGLLAVFKVAAGGGSIVPQAMAQYINQVIQ